MMSSLGDPLDANGSASKGTLSAFGFDKMKSQLIHFSAESSPLVFMISHDAFLLGLGWARSIPRAPMQRKEEQMKFRAARSSACLRPRLAVTHSVGTWTLGS